MTFFLKRTHWQLFLMLIVPLLYTGDDTIVKFITIGWTFIWTSWIYAIGTAAHEQVGRKSGVSRTYFDISFITVVVYVTVTTLLVDGAYSVSTSTMATDNGTDTFFFVSTLLAFFNILYLFYFAAKMLRSTENNKLVPFSESVGYFFGFWFFPIGVWFIQPKAQQLVKRNPNSGS